MSHKEKLINNLHALKRIDPVTAQIMHSTGLSLDEIEEALKDLVDNLFFVDRATWGLDLFEKELGIEIDHSKGFDERRSIIKAKSRGSGKLTLDLIDSVCDAWKRADVLVTFEGGTIKIKFVDTGGVPENIDDLKNQIEDIKPAHLPVEWLYSYWIAGVFDEWNLTAAEFDAANLTAAEWDVTIFRPV